MLSDVGFWLAAAQGPYVDGFIVAGDFNKDRAMDGGNLEAHGSTNRFKYLQSIWGL